MPHKLTSVVTILAFVQGFVAVVALSRSDTSLPRFVGHSKTVKGRGGETVTITCEVLNLGSYLILWKKESVLISAGPLKVIWDDRITVAGTSLTITDVNTRDGGYYSCEINTEPALSQTIHLDILEPPRIRTIPESGKVIARKGEIVTLECLGEGNPLPTVTWKKSIESTFAIANIQGITHVTQQAALPANNTDISEGPTLTLEITNQNQSGKYFCMADNGIGKPVISHISLHVLYAPEIHTERNWIHTAVGREAQLACIVSADPASTVTWYREQRPIAASDTRVLRSDGENYSLIFRQVAESDFGTYSCIAENSMGRSSQILELSGRPSRPHIKNAAPETSSESYALSWTVESYTPIEEYRLLLRKVLLNETDDEERVWNSVIIPVSSESGELERSQSYTLHGVDPTTLYEVAVAARNRYGLGEQSEHFRFRPKDEILHSEVLVAKNLAGSGNSNKVSHRYFLGWIILTSLATFTSQLITFYSC